MKNISIEDKAIKIDEGVRRTGKDEMNLIELPFTLLTKRNPKNLKTIERHWTSKGEDNKEKKFYKIITGSDKWGLPTFIGEEVYLACMELSHRQGFQNRKVYTTKYELIRLMGWVMNGESYKRLIKAFNQLGGLWITTNAFWDNKQKKYREIGFGIIDDYMFFEEEKKGRKNRFGEKDSPLGTFSWNEKFFEHSLQKDNIKTLDTSLYFSLTSHAAKRLYRFFDKRLYRQDTFEIDLFKLAFEKMEMIGNYNYPSEVVRKLNSAFTELRDKSLFEVEVKTSNTDSGYKVCVKPSGTARIFTGNSSNSDDKKENIIAKDIVNYFHTQNNSVIKPPTQRELHQAKELLTIHNTEEVKHIVEFGVEQAKKTKFEMQYFGAVLGYKDKAMDNLKQKTEQQISTDKKKEQENLKKRYEDYRQNHIDWYLTQIPQPVYEDELKKIEETLRTKHPIIGNRQKLIYREIVQAKLEDNLIEQGKINILSFEEWKLTQ